MDFTNLSSALRALVVRGRKRRGWTQKELAERSGVSLRTLRKFEQTGVISTDRLSRLIGYLGLETAVCQAIQPLVEPELPSVDEFLKKRKP